MSDTKEQHIEWCKKRALEYVDAGNLKNAFLSFQSDMRKHDETENHSFLELFSLEYFAGHLKTPKEMRKFIECVLCAPLLSCCIHTF